LLAGLGRRLLIRAEAKMAGRKRNRSLEGMLDGAVEHPEGQGPESAGQSGDMQSLPDEARAADQSVADLAAEDQPFEAAIVEGVERAGDNPNEPVRARSENRPAKLHPADEAVSSDAERPEDEAT
jgi:hypothetical protein